MTKGKKLNVRKREHIFFEGSQTESGETKFIFGSEWTRVPAFFFEILSNSIDEAREGYETN